MVVGHEIEITDVSQSMTKIYKEQPNDLYGHYVLIHELDTVSSDCIYLPRTQIEVMRSRLFIR